MGKECRIVWTILAEKLFFHGFVQSENRIENGSAEDGQEHLIKLIRMALHGSLRQDR